MSFQVQARRVLTASLALAGMSVFGAAKADTVLYQSATDSYRGLSDVIQSGRYVGAVFTLDQAASITGIGAQFVNTASGSIFAEIVEVPDGDTSPAFMPSQSAADGNYVAGTNVVIDGIASALKAAYASTGKYPPVVDYTQSLAQAVTLQAGTYAVIFGSGAFGANGWADIGLGNAATPGASIFNANENIYGDVWKTTDAGAEIFVEGTLLPTPLPGTLPLTLAGFAVIGFIMWRRKDAYLLG